MEQNIEPQAPKPTAADSQLQQSTDAVQMAELQPKDGAQASDSIPHPATTSSPEDETTSSQTPVTTDASKGKEKASSTPSEPPPPPQKETAAPADDSLSISPSATAPPPSDNPVCNITLLLPTGPRHPYKIDERYLAKRNVAVPDLTESGKKDPFSISIYTLKELILREWREEWNDKPASPSSIRLIHFGKLLDDKEQLKKYQFSREAPNVVHMSVRPAEMMEEDEAAKGKSSGREGRSREGSGGCCVIL